MAKITIKDVAKAANVDLSTVSRVLNSSFDTHKYTTATIERVKNAAEELGYKPSVAARSLRTGKTMLLGLIVADISNPFFSTIASHLDNAIGKQGYRLVISSTNESPKRQRGHIEGMIAQGVDGLIVAPCGSDGLEKAYQTKTPLVTIDRPLNNVEIPFVGLDNIAAGQLLAKKLIHCGCESIGVVMPESKTDQTVQERLSGMESELKKNNRSLSWILTVPPASFLSDTLRKTVVDKLKKTDTYPDAIVGMTNISTIGIIKALEELNIAWGDNIGLAGIDDFTAAPIVSPAVSVVSQPLQHIAQSAFSLLLEYMESKKRYQEGKILRVKPLWLERSSLLHRR